jgi:IS5 family transposase
LIWLQSSVQLDVSAKHEQNFCNSRVDKRHRGRTAKRFWRLTKRRAAIKPEIRHLKREHRMDRNSLSGVECDRFNAILSAFGMNFHKLLLWAAAFLRQIFYWLLLSQRTIAMLVFAEN